MSIFKKIFMAIIPVVIIGASLVGNITNAQFEVIPNSTSNV
jgi:hypothetical protein